MNTNPLIGSLAVAIAAWFMLACQVAQAQPAKPRVFVEATAENDPVGEKLAFALREQIRRSAGMALTEDKDSAARTLVLVTLDPRRNQAGSGQSTSYAVAMVSSGGYFQDLWAGICSDAKVESCAMGIVASTDKSLSDQRKALIHLTK